MIELIIVAGVIVAGYTLRALHTRLPGQEWLCWLHAWQTVKDTRVHRYKQCSKCRARSIVKVLSLGQPTDKGWLQTGEWTNYGR